MNGKLDGAVQTKHECVHIKNMFLNGKAAWRKGEKEGD